jgi:hypothetical protein
MPIHESHQATKESDMFEDQGEPSALSHRIHTVRLQLYGECGGPILAQLLGIPQRRLTRIEAGGPIPAEILLKLIDVTGVNPGWLLSGEGERYGRPACGRIASGNPGSRFG